MIAISLGNIIRVVAMKVNIQTSQLTLLQSINFKKTNIHHFQINGDLYLLGCTGETFCAVYKWIHHQFRRQNKLSMEMLDKIKKIHFGHDIVIVEDTERNLLFQSIGAGVNMHTGTYRSNTTDDPQYVIYKSALHENLVIKFYWFFWKLN